MSMSMSLYLKFCGRIFHLCLHISKTLLPYNTVLTLEIDQGVEVFSTHMIFLLPLLVSVNIQAAFHYL